jgi:hypothetical protein
MKKFTLKLVLFFTTLQLIFVGTITSFSEHIFDELYSLVRYQKNVCQNIKNESVKYLFVGNSQILNGIDPQLFPHSRFLTIPGGSSYESYLLLECYLKSNHPQNIILTSSPLHSFWPYNFWKINMFFNLYSWEDLFLLSKNLKGKHSFREISGSLLGFENIHSRFDFFLNALQHKLKLPNKYLASLQNALYDSRYPYYQKMYQELEKTKGNVFLSRYAGFSKIIRAGLNKHLREERSFKLEPIQKTYLHKIASLLDKTQTNIYFTIMPLMKSDYLFLKASYYEHYKAEIINIFPPQMNFLDLPYYFNDKMFLDTIHFNLAGRKEYTLQLIKRLEQ